MRASSSCRRQGILEAAARLFSKRGFDGTTTRDIAQSAGVNEAIIFRHFASKEELDWAAVSEQIRKKVGSDPNQLHLHAARDTKRKLSAFTRRLLERGEEDVALTRLLLFSGLRNPEMSEHLWHRYASECHSAGVREGRLRNIDPQGGARAFLGMVVYHRILGELFAARGHQKHSRYLSQQLADIWLNGVSAGQRKSGFSQEIGNGAKVRAGNGARENLVELKRQARSDVSRYKKRIRLAPNRRSDSKVTGSDT